MVRPAALQAGAFGAQQSGIEALDRRIRLGEVIERRIDRDYVGSQK
jgi:hypothetical protein